MKTRYNLNSMYVNRQPEKLTLSIIHINLEEIGQPISEEIHLGLDELSSVSDIVFMFDLGASRKIDCNKFTNLYQGCSWIEGDWTESLPNTLEYAVEIFNDQKKIHTGVLYLELDNCKNIPSQTILNLGASGLRKPILTILRKTPEELFEYYKYVREEPEGKWVEIWDKIKRNKQTSPDLTNFYSLWKTDSDLIYLVGDAIKALIQGRDIISTFTTPKDYIASLIKKSKIDYTDRDVRKYNFSGTERI